MAVGLADSDRELIYGITEYSEETMFIRHAMYTYTERFDMHSWQLVCAGHTTPVARAIEKLYINMSGGPKHRLSHMNMDRGGGSFGTSDNLVKAVYVLAARRQPRDLKKILKGSQHK